ncbi:hypothetical protein FN976_02655 [Caenimonas sedimenti]|uniref:Uncharacterized protein n=1 Tax=Caenimonas sedimenti TaxID=2596921 RepID=A0A562ZXZ2_9BURK|nr:hypothetical protein [Caenimonas sedimenti]TWO73155.1 hypothetical protein FN976_02655 [Caenimonas sedimenti]
MISSPIDTARDKAEHVQRELELASAELGLAQGALERDIPEDVKEQGDIAWAMDQNAEVERKVRQASEELEEVTELLEQAKRSA